MTAPAPRRKTHFLTDQGGAAALEFALVSSAFISLIMGIAYIGIMAFNTVAIDWAVKAAARQAEISTTATQDSLTTTINNYLSSWGLSTATVTYTITNLNGVNISNIAASYTQDYSIPFIPTIHMTFSSSATVPKATST